MRRKFIRLSWNRLPALAFGFGMLAACESGDEENVAAITPAWTANQEFHIEARYQKVSMRTTTGDMGADLEDTGSEAATGYLDDQWTEPVYWRYQVLHTNLVPAEGEDFYEYSIKGGTGSPLTVIKASLNYDLSADSEFADADPKVYMVIREDRLRIAGLVTFYTINGERLSEALTVGDDSINRSYNLLSQSNLSVIPHFIPPFPIRAENVPSFSLENGEVVSFGNATTSSVDVVYENSMDDSLIAETWENGQPWSTATITPTLETRLLTPDELDDLTGGLGDAPENNHTDADDFDYVERLKAPFDLDAVLKVDGLIGNQTKSVREGFRPWAGSWWRQSEGALIFGHLSSANDTISELKKAGFTTTATELQNLGEELRNLQRNGQGSSAAYNEKVTQYRNKQETLTNDLVKFYNAVRTAIDGGKITITTDGRIKASANWNSSSSDPYPAFDLPIANLSPLDKFALMQQKNGRTHGTNPWFGPAWEMLNHWSPAGSSWYGHCNGWSAAAILTNEPRAEKTKTYGSSNQYSMKFSVADQKGLLSETYYSQLSEFYGARYNGDSGDDITDLSPKAVLQILTTYIGERGVPLVFDTSANEEVWNFPAWEYTLNLSETGGAGPGSSSTGGLININTAGKEQLKTLWGISDVRADRIIAYRQANGPFQQTVDIVKVRGIGYGIYNRIKDQITVTASTQLRNFTGSVTVRFSTDGVGYSHVDTNVNAPQGFQSTWNFTLEASPEGEIISGAWDNPNESNSHPDFAWVPYVNTVRSGSSENPYLEWTDLKDYLGAGTVRE
jgi:competence ComEA-like helix-hairpin-helix protein